MLYMLGKDRLSKSKNFCGCRSFNSGIGSAASKTAIDNAVRAGAKLHIGCHEAVAVSGAGQYVDRRLSMMDYVYRLKLAGLCDVPTILQWYASLGKGG